mmetsp:Transcript_21370/g.23903  ORF Transcript_21370/g.23903 Transcript_21370/m.23903 type:complete len:329 (-) Transcript_21370:203-1189(-)
MVLLRSLPEFSSMCLNAIDFLGEAMSCTSKDSALVNTLNCSNTMNCMDSSAWCATDSRDDEQKEGIVTESTSASSSSSSKPSSMEMEVSNSNDNKNNNNASSTSRKGVSDELSSSVHQLLHDSTERTNLSQSHRTDSSTTLLSVPEGDITIFRTHDDTNDRTAIDDMEKTRSAQEVEGEEEEESKSDTDTPNQGVQFSKLQRCTAWSQADDQNCHIYSFEDDNTCLLLLSPDTTTHDEEAKVNLVHWDDIVHGVIECQETPIFRRPTTQDVVDPQLKLDRCAAWSVDDSSNSHSLASARGSVRLGAIQEETSTTKIHWDAIVKDSIYA